MSSPSLGLLLQAGKARISTFVRLVSADAQEGCGHADAQAEDWVEDFAEEVRLGHCVEGSGVGRARKETQDVNQ